jgi:hypothetical protein
LASCNILSGCFFIKGIFLFLIRESLKDINDNLEKLDIKPEDLDDFYEDEEDDYDDDEEEDYISDVDEEGKFVMQGPNSQVKENFVLV